jgi:hypothetical protein
MATAFDEYLPPIVTCDRATEILAPHFDQLREPFFVGCRAWEKMTEEDEERMIVLPTRVWAGIVHSYIVREVIRRFEPLKGQGIRIRSEFDSTMLTFGEELVVRFKKFRAGHKPSNSPTKRQFDFDRQCLKLPDLPPEATNLTIGYIPNPVGIEVESIDVACWRVHTLEWTISLYRRSDGTGFLPLPIAPDGPELPKTGTVVRAAVEPKKAKGEGG